MKRINCNLMALLFVLLAGCNRTSVKDAETSELEMRPNPNFSIIVISREMAENKTNEVCRMLAGTNMAAARLLGQGQRFSSYFDGNRSDHIIVVYSGIPYPMKLGGSIDRLLEGTPIELVVFHVFRGMTRLSNGELFDVSELIESSSSYIL